MLKNYLLLIFLLITHQAVAQLTVSGTIVDNKSKEAIPFANIYVNNTSIGTITDSLGKFKLVVPSSDKIELIVSHLIYQKKMFVVSPANASNVMVFMDAQNNVLNQVVIQGKKNSKADIENWLELFSSNLIGKYPGVSTLCKIKNANVLYFNYNKRTSQLQAYAREPILIENLALGYLIKLDLEEFVYNYMSNDVTFKYSIFFENMATSRVKLAQVIKKRRLLYAGSNMHFMRTIYQNNTEAEGFSIYRYRSIQNAELARVEKVVRKRMELSSANQANPVLDLARLFSSPDTIRYYRNVMQQSKILRFDTLKLSGDAISKPNKMLSVVNVNYKDTLMINYRGVDPMKANTLTFAQAPENRVQVNKKIDKPVKYALNWDSFLFFIDKKGINIKSNGYYPEMGLFVYGDMGERRLAGALPFDYNPNEEL